MQPELQHLTGVVERSMRHGATLIMAVRAVPAHALGQPPSRASRSSCLRIGRLSMERVISRTSRGNGFRRITRPSLLTTISMKPRGRNSRRISVSSAGAESAIRTTSRFTSSSMRAARSSICVRKAGSCGASEKTINGRATHLNLSRSMSCASKTAEGSACHAVTTESADSPASVATAAHGARPASNTARNAGVMRDVMPPPYAPNISRIRRNRRGLEETWPNGGPR